MPCVESAPAARGLGGGGGGESGAYIGGCARGRVKPGSGARAGQTRIGKGPGQNRIGNTGGSNPKRERTAQKRKNRRGDAGFYQRLFTGLLTKVFTAPSKNLGFYLGLVAPGFYLGKNLGRSPGVQGAGEDGGLGAPDGSTNEAHTHPNP